MHENFKVTFFYITVLQCYLRFNGYVEHESGVKEPVDKVNLLLRGCEVRNTDFVEGIVLYAGTILSHSFICFYVEDL